MIPGKKNYGNAYNKKGMLSIYAGYLWKNNPIDVKGSLDR